MTEPFRDPDFPLEARLDDLLSRLTRDEKIALMHQHQPAIPRLGLAAFHTGCEALHGVAWLGPATVFPQAVGLASTWSPDLVRRVGSATGDEVRGFHHRDPSVGLNVWAPVVNLLRDPRWGRNEEGYSEDPLLTGIMATAYAGGLRGDHPRYLKTAPTLKHFLAYNVETDRATMSVSVRPRVLREYELPAFAAAIAAGAATGVMPSYNLVNGRPAHLTPLVNDVVRRWSEHELLVVSDAFAPSNVAGAEAYYPSQAEAHAALVRAGLDSFTDQGTDPTLTVSSLTQALDRGLLTEADLDRALRRTFSIRLRLGELDPPEGNPYAAITDEVIGAPAHRELAREAVRQAMVLLRNEGSLLPLRPDPGLRMAVLGPMADTLFEDWYSGTLADEATPARGIRERLGAGASVTVHEGADRIALRVGAGGPYVRAVPGAGGVLLADAADPGEGFDLQDWGEGVWTLRAAVNRRYVTIGETGVLANTSRQPKGWVVGEAFRMLPRGDREVLLRSAATGRYVTVADGRLAASAASPAGATRFGREVLAGGIEEAARLAAEADVAVVTIGNAPLINGRETQDRRDVRPSACQRRLVRAVAGANPRTVLLVESSYPMAIPWEQSHVPAILWSSHGGQEMGPALAEVLFGDHAPAGRLTQTWYRSARDLGDLADYDVIGSRRTYLYFDGTPLYPFGHGLTYAEFRYEELRLEPAVVGSAGTVAASVRVTNAGSGASDEVVQLYTRKRTSRVEQPRRRLGGFERAHFAPGETRTLRFELPAADLAVWDVARGRFVVEAGPYDVLVGASSADIRLDAALEVVGEAIGPRAGASIAAADFDDAFRVAIVDETRERGDAVAPVQDGAWIAFRDVDLGAGVDRFELRAGRVGRGRGTVDVRLDGPSAGALLASAEVPCTGGCYEWTAVSAPVRAASGVHDLYLVLSGDIRVARFGFSRDAAAR